MKAGELVAQQLVAAAKALGVALLDGTWAYYMWEAMDAHAMEMASREFKTNPSGFDAEMRPYARAWLASAYPKYDTPYHWRNRMGSYYELLARYTYDKHFKTTHTKKEWARLAHSWLDYERL